MEDEMYELDVQLSCVRRTAESVKALRDPKEQHQKIDIGNYFSALSLSCIRKEYKELGCFVIEQLRQYPKHVVPRILEQLEIKEEELVEDREKLDEYWRGFHKKRQNSVTNCCVI
ncbi:hypothetical protein P3S67_016001 [Capsicum chacoense]